MKIHKVVLFAERRKLFLRVVWTRGKRDAATQWCEGVKEFKLEHTLKQHATMFIDESNKKNGPVITSKDSKLYLELRDRLDGKITKYAKLSIDLSKFINLEKPNRLINKKMVFEKQRNNKQAYISITVKATAKPKKSSNSNGNFSDTEYSVTMTEDRSMSRDVSSSYAPNSTWTIDNKNENMNGKNDDSTRKDIAIGDEKKNR